MIAVYAFTYVNHHDISIQISYLTSLYRSKQIYSNPSDNEILKRQHSKITVSVFTSWSYFDLITNHFYYHQLLLRKLSALV